ncbi:unnamed protein product [Musa acuminata var. zebrina]
MLQIGCPTAVAMGQCATILGSWGETARCSTSMEPRERTSLWCPTTSSRSTCTSSASGRRGGPATLPGCKPWPSCSSPTPWSSARWDGKKVTVPTEGEAEWRVRAGGEGDGREVVAERTGETNSVRVTTDVKVVPITEGEDPAHGYRLPPGDTFAHLETQFRFGSLTERVEGILGQTYRPDYVSPAKKGVPMPTTGVEDKYRVASFLSTRCTDCRFHPGAHRVVDESDAVDVAQY